MYFAIKYKPYVYVGTYFSAYYFVLILCVRVMYFYTLRVNTIVDTQFSNIYRFQVAYSLKACLHECELDNALKANQAKSYSI